MVDLLWWLVHVRPSRCPNSVMKSQCVQRKQVIFRILIIRMPGIIPFSTCYLQSNSLKLFSAMEGPQEMAP